jgi:hypothetical protein
LRKFRLVSLCPGLWARHWLMYQRRFYLMNIFLWKLHWFAYTIIHYNINNDLLSQICSHYYVYTYIHHGPIGHRNKLASCQLKLLVSCSNDEHQTLLKWDRTSHPVAPECRVSHILRLKFLQLMFYVSVCHAALGSMYQLTDTRAVMFDVNYPDFPQAVIFLPISTHSIFPRCCTAIFSTWKRIS